MFPARHLMHVSYHRFGSLYISSTKWSCTQENPDPWRATNLQAVTLDKQNILTYGKAWLTQL
jgi:hypothetical protein